jgi:hypothetical protein
MRRHPFERPENFELNTDCQLAQGLVFAGLGRHTKTKHYHDSSLYGNHGTLTNMEPETDWVWSEVLGRWCVNFGGTDEFVELATSGSSLDFSGGFWTMATWFKNGSPASPAYAGLMAFNNTGINAQSGDGLGNSIGAIQSDFLKTVTSAYVASRGTLIHVAVVQPGTSATGMLIYVNGVPAAQSSATDSGYGGAGKNRLGMLYTYLCGSLSDSSAWHRVLSPAEIQQLADPSNVMLSGLILPPKRRLWAVSLGGVTPAYRNLILGGGVL